MIRRISTSIIFFKLIKFNFSILLFLIFSLLPFFYFELAFEVCFDKGAVKGKNPFWLIIFLLSVITLLLLKGLVELILLLTWHEVILFIFIEFIIEEFSLCWYEDLLFKDIFFSYWN